MDLMVNNDDREVRVYLLEVHTPYKLTTFFVND